MWDSVSKVRGVCKFNLAGKSPFLKEREREHVLSQLGKKRES